MGKLFYCYGSHGYRLLKFKVYNDVDNHVEVNLSQISKTRYKRRNGH